jgi:hypothetical protein
MSDADGLSIDRIVALVRVSPHAAAAEMRALGELSQIRPEPDEWCANEVLGHLIEADRRGFIGRVRQAVDEDHPTFVAWDQPSIAAVRQDRYKSAGVMAMEFLEMRGTDLAYVAGLSEADMDRGGEHPEVGLLTVRNLLHEWVHHDREHLAQLMAVSQSFAWPAMGNSRKFAEPA